MARFIRNTVLLAKIETTEGTDAAPTGTDNALLISNVSINPLNATNVDRSNVRPYFGGSEQLVGTANVSVDFTAELAGSGTAGTAAPWGALLRACGFAETGSSAYKQYAPDTPGNQKAATLYYYDDGVLHKLLGAKGTFKLMMGIGERPAFQFSMTGKDGGVSAVVNPVATLTAWKQPLVITDPNTGNVKFGGSYLASDITGGTSYTSQGLQMDLGNSVQYTPLLGGEFIDITDRAVTGSIQLDLTAAQEVSFMASVKSNGLQSVSLEHGTEDGSIVGVFMAAVQLINPSKADANGRRLVGFDMRSVPVVGNDDLIIYCK